MCQAYLDLAGWLYCDQLCDCAGCLVGIQVNMVESLYIFCVIVLLYFGC